VTSARVTARRDIAAVPLDIAGAHARLHGGGRIDIDLDRRAAPRLEIALEMRGYVEGEGVASCIHEVVDLASGDLRWRLEVGRKEDLGDACRQLGMVLVDDGNRRVVELLGIAQGLAVDGEGEGVEH
jgi:hypothetical protein